MANEIEKIKEFSFLSVLDEGYGQEVAAAATALTAIKKVTNDSEARAANAALKAAKAVYNIVHHEKTGKRIEITRELDALKKRIMEAAKNATSQLDEPMESVKKLVEQYAAEKLRKQREEEERKAAEAARIAAEEEERRVKEAEMENMFGDDSQPAPSTVAADAGQSAQEPEVLEPEVVQPEKKKPVVAGVTVRTSWTFEIANPNLVPREFCKPDEQAIRVYMNNAKANGSPIESLHIDGVTFAEKVSV